MLRILSRYLLMTLAGHLLLAELCYGQTTTTTTLPTAVQERTMREQALGVEQARLWGLDAEEWKRYRELMAGPLGLQAPNLDPLSVLGISARTDAERQRYAELQVRMEAARVERLLVYQRAYDEAWRRLYPSLRPVEIAGKDTSRGAVTEQSHANPRRLAIFVRDGCSACSQRVKQLQERGVALDVYVVGSRNDDSQIRRWARSVPIDPPSVRSGRITLNHDAGRWLSMGTTQALPAVGYVTDGEWHPK